MITGRVEGEEEEGFDPRISWIYSPPSSPLSLYASGLAYENEYVGFTMNRSPSPTPLSRPPPWSAPWNSFDDYPIPEYQHCFGVPRNPIPAKAPHTLQSIKDFLRGAIVSSMSIYTAVSSLMKGISLLGEHNRNVCRTLNVEIVREVFPRRSDGLLFVLSQNNLDLDLVLNERAATYMMAWLLNNEDLMITDEQKGMLKHLCDVKLKFTQTSVTTNISICHIQPSVPLTPLEENRVCTQLDTNLCSNSDIVEASYYLSQNKAPTNSSTVEPTCGGEIIAKLDSEEQKSMGGGDAIKGWDGTCEAEGLTPITFAENLKKRTSCISSSKSAITGSSISLEDIRQHGSMTREKAAESLGVSVSTLKRICRKHCIPRWPYLKKTKKVPSLSDLNSVNVALKDSIAGEIVTTIPSLCHVRPMVPLTSLEEYSDWSEQNSYVCLNFDKMQSAAVTLSRTLSLETPKQDVFPVTVEVTDNLPSNESPMILVDVASLSVRETQGSDAIANLDSEEQKSMVGCDAIYGENGVGEAEGLASSSKRAGTGTSICLEDLQQHCYMTSKEAAEKLGVSISTLKRACREHGISSWLHLKRRKKSESPSEMKSMNAIKNYIVTAGSSQTDLRAVNTVQEVKFVTVKAKYEDKIIKFDLPYLSEMVELEEEIANKLKLEIGSFIIEYEDEDGDQILLTSSKDLRYCIDTWTSLGKTTIRMLVKIATRS